MERLYNKLKSGEKTTNPKPFYRQINQDHIHSYLQDANATHNIIIEEKDKEKKKNIILIIIIFNNIGRTWIVVDVQGSIDYHR